MRPQTIQIYLPSGDPAGIRIAEITTRTVRIFEVPRSLMAEFRKRPESKQVCVYFLFGTSEDGRTAAYIGQTGNSGDRFKQHESSKDFWDTALIAVSLTNQWTSTHASYMEWKALQLANQSGRYEMTNGNGASNPHTPEPMEADCAEYMETISVLLSTLGYPILQPLVSGDSNGAGAAGEKLYLKDRQADGTAVVTSEGVVVLAGSSGRDYIANGSNKFITTHRTRLLDQRAAVISDGRFRLLQDCLFPSPSTAGAVLVGGNVNGRLAWKSSTGMTYAELEEKQLESV